MRSYGVRLAARLRAGDLLILSGPLGAGKTTLVQGIAEGLKVRGPITSPTFVIARVHPSLCGGPPRGPAAPSRLGAGRGAANLAWTARRKGRWRSGGGGRGRVGGRAGGGLGGL